MQITEIKDLLEYKSEFYNRPEFIQGDPVSIPHRFSKKEDIEISGFLTAMISWGQRKTIISNADILMNALDNSPYEFIMHAENSDLAHLQNFKHRTFNGIDCKFFINSLQNIYQNHDGLENVFSGTPDIKLSIINFRRIFFSIPYPSRSQKHIADPERGSAAKRINMFLRWMVRNDNRGVDFGLWDSISPSRLYCPLDLHTGIVARKLGLISRRQNDWIALEELMAHLKSFDPDDPVKYDYALFGLGIFEAF